MEMIFTYARSHYIYVAVTVALLTIQTAGVIIEGIHLPPLRQLPLLTLLALLGIFANQLGYICGVYYTSPVFASAMQPCIPVMAYVLALMVRMEPFPSIKSVDGWLKIIGVGITAVGGVLLVLAPGGVNSPLKPSDTPINSTEPTHDSPERDGMQVDASWGFAFGELMLIGNTCSMAAYVILQKKFIFQRGSDAEKSIQNHPLAEEEQESEVTLDGSDVIEKKLVEAQLEEELEEVEVSEFTQTDAPHSPFGLRVHFPSCLNEWAVYPVMLTAWTYGLGVIWMAVAAIYYIVTDVSVFVLKEDAIAPLVYSIFVSSALCYGLLSFCNKHIPSIVVTASWPLQVLVSVALSYVFYGEVMAISQYAGGALICAGLLCVSVGAYRSSHEDHSNDKLDSDDSDASNLRTKGETHEADEQLFADVCNFSTSLEVEEIRHDRDEEDLTHRNAALAQ